MNLTINGENQVFSAETLGALVEHLGMKPDRVAIELNREIVPRDQWPQTSLHDGDRLEIVHFVGGGRFDSCRGYQTLRDHILRISRGTIFSRPVILALCKFAQTTRSNWYINDLRLGPWVWQRTCTLWCSEAKPSPRRLQ